MRRLVASALVATAVNAPASAGEFALSASPPRFELKAKPGDIVRGVVELDNAATSIGTYAVATSEWTLDQKAEAIFTPALATDSCRPWVAIERARLAIAPRAKFRFRYEIAVPATAPSRECRFAIMVEGVDDKPTKGEAFPVSGRLGIIVYLRIGDAHAETAITESAPTVTVDGARLPAIVAVNRGDAHDRLGGFLSGEDAAGVRRDFTPEALPILAGETRTIALSPDTETRTDGAPAPKQKPIVYPLTITGTIEHNGKPIKITRRYD